MDLDIYKMKLHEMRRVGEPSDPLATTILRVPGGWVYSQFDKSNSMLSSVFVPFDNGYQDSVRNIYKP